ncbi:MAG: Ig-like domain-containing protein, partial [Alistipes sp.]|nr:Ig-like domain-containing protein [Candidatus Minthomonas equi]
MKCKSIINPFSLLGLVLISPFFTKSCANVSGSPTGGPKDTIPPVLVACEPLYNAVNVPTQGKDCKIIFTFDEYVQVKDAMKYIFLSPPQVKRPEYKIKGKSVVVTFKEPLDSNTTYSLDLGQSISDNNEGNPFPQFVHSFSTGSYIDSMFVSGTVSNAVTLLPEKEITVLFHSDTTDSAVFNVLPAAAAKTDPWGYFTVRNLKPSEYRVYAIKDENNNNKYDQYT